MQRVREKLKFQESIPNVCTDVFEFTVEYFQCKMIKEPSCLETEFTCVHSFVQAER